jgi:hypothetical protein
LRSFSEERPDEDQDGRDPRPGAGELLAQMPGDTLGVLDRVGYGAEEQQEDESHPCQRDGGAAPAAREDRRQDEARQGPAREPRGHHPQERLGVRRGEALELERAVRARADRQHPGGAKQVQPSGARDDRRQAGHRDG